MSLIDEILNYSIFYKGIKVNLLGVPQFKNRSAGTIKTTLYYMRKQGLINKVSQGWNITALGKKHVKKKMDSLRQFPNTFKKDDPKNMLVMFDIPETKKAHREWFRWHLKKFNYIMVQKSVWVGPSPLPKEFLDYIKKIKLRNSVKTFKLANPYKVI